MEELFELLRRSWGDLARIELEMEMEVGEGWEGDEDED